MLLPPLDPLPLREDIELLTDVQGGGGREEDEDEDTVEVVWEEEEAMPPVGCFISTTRAASAVARLNRAPPSFKLPKMSVWKKNGKKGR